MSQQSTGKTPEYQRKAHELSSQKLQEGASLHEQVMVLTVELARIAGRPAHLIRQRDFERAKLKITDSKSA